MATNPALVQLLARLNSDAAGVPVPAPSMPIPYAPVGNLGPLSNDTALAYGARNPEPVPPRFVQPGPADANFVSQYAGERPTPPAPLAQLQRIMNMLGGIGAGMQGQGAQYLERLNEPTRRYERDLERYEGRRTRGIELAERRAEREADRANRMAELSYERDYNLYLKKLGIRAGEADERTRQIFEIYKLDRQQKIEEARERRREFREREDEARHVSDQFFSLTKNKNLSDEIGRYRAGLSDKPLSPAAVQLYNKVTRLGEMQMRRAFDNGSGGGGAGGVGNAVLKAAQAVEVAKGELMALVGRGASSDEIAAARKRIDRAVGGLRRFPGRLQGGLDVNGWPWAQVWTPQGWMGIAELSQGAAQPQGAQGGRVRPDLQRFGIVPEQGMYFDLRGGGSQQQQPQGPTDAEVQTYAQTYGVSTEVARKELLEMKR